MGFIKHLYIYITLAISLLSCLTSCNNTEYGGPPKFILYVEDAPADYVYLRTSIDKVAIQHTDGQWVEITDVVTIPFDLLTLCGGKMLKVTDAVVPEGEYVKLRVTFTDRDAELGEKDQNVKLPMEASHRVREFDVAFTARQDYQSFLIMDISATESILTNEGGTRSFAPACRLANFETQGTLWGMIGDPSGVPIAESMLVEVRRKITSTVVATTYTSRTSAGFFLRLEPGTYDIVITPGFNSKYESATISGVSVNAQQSTQTGMTRLPMLPQENQEK